MLEYLIPTATAKIKLIISFITASMIPLVAFYSPVAENFNKVLWLVLIDILTGMYASRVVEKKAINSRSFFRKLPQFLLFIVALTATIHADPFFVTFGIPANQCVSIVLAAYSIYELLSILENCGRCGLPVAKQLHKLLKGKLPDELKEDESSVESKPEETK